MGLKGSTPILDAAGLLIAIVVARYNQDITEGLLRGATDTLRERGATWDPVVFWVPGALEIPVVAMHLAETGDFDAIVALGCVIKGETAHFEFVAGECARGVMQVQLETGVPCTFGVLTTFDREQAVARSGDEGNKGAEAVEAAIETANLIRAIQAAAATDGGEGGEGGEA